MSAKASKAVPTVLASAGEHGAGAVAPGLEGLVPMVESETDQHETLLQYGDGSKLPLPVVLVWICALVGLGTYMVTLYLPDLALWYKR